MTALHVILPAGIDDLNRPSGGNTYDRRVVEGLRELGWDVHEHEVAGAWPRPGPASLEHLGVVVAALPAGALVLVDGLVGSGADAVLVPQAGRLRLVLLVHMPLGPLDPLAAEGERRVLQAATAVVTTSDWTRRLVLDRYTVAADRVHVAWPGVDEAPVAPGSPSGGELLCVAAVTPHKGHLDLADALARVADLPWHCRCVGSLTVDPSHVAALRERLGSLGLVDRVTFTGPLTGAELDRAYAAADLLVLPSLAETFGMVVSEALARGVPVLVTGVGGVAEALGVSSGAAPDPRAPGLLVSPGRPDEFAAALRTWLTDDDLRAELRRRAAERRPTLARWHQTIRSVAQALDRARGS